MSFKIPFSDALYHAIQGLFSGTRLTDSENTIDNRGYKKIAQKKVEEDYNIDPDDEYCTHQSDDMWISNGKRHWAALMFLTMHRMGFCLNKMKQMFGRYRGEYLRDYYNDGKTNGYVNRAIVNYLLRPVYNAFEHNLVHRRGIDFNVLNILYDCDAKHYLRIFAHHTDKQLINIPEYVLAVYTYNGGYGFPRPGTVTMTNKFIPKVPELKMDDPSINDKLPSNMTDNWISLISENLPREERETRIRSTY